jgi:hypothetical protein
MDGRKVRWKGAKNSLPKSPFSAVFSGCSFHKLVDVYTSLSSHMDSSTRDKWAYLAWDGVQRGRGIGGAVFQQSYFRSLPPEEAMAAVVSIHILAFTEKETTKEVEEGMVMAKLEREPYHICSQCGFGDVFNYDVRSLEGSLQGSWPRAGKRRRCLLQLDLFM